MWRRNLCFILHLRTPGAGLRNNSNWQKATLWHFSSQPTGSQTTKSLTYWDTNMPRLDYSSLLKKTSNQRLSRLVLGVTHFSNYTRSCFLKQNDSASENYFILTVKRPNKTGTDIFKPYIVFITCFTYLLQSSNLSYTFNSLASHWP